MKNPSVFRLALLFAVIFRVAPLPAAEAFDLVIANGRVMDPESGLDATRHVGIRDGMVESISETALSGRETIDATGLVVAPGFIDLHQHGFDEDSVRLKALDGVTSILELEVGTAQVDAWYRERAGKSRLHHGVAAGHIHARMKVMGDFPSFLPKSDSRAATITAGPEQMAAMQEVLSRGLDEGAVAMGFGLSYTPAANAEELQAMFEVAARHGVSCHVHLRGRGDTVVEGALEVLAPAKATGAPLHIVHLNSTSLKAAPRMLALVESWQNEGLDVSAEVYPWTAGMSEIQSALFAEGWQDRFGITWSDLQWGATGERLTEESFARHRQSGGLVIIHTNTEAMVRQTVVHPVSMIASDGLPGHPRNAGTYARILGHYVRELGTLDLMTALKKISLMPAQRLERRVPEMRLRGRVREGGIADLTLFDPAAVAARATYEDPLQPSAGIAWVLVAGTVVVREGRLVEEAHPGRALRVPMAAP